MNELASQRCFHHAEREAAARCTECGRFFCRECAVEHEDRILCAPCLRKAVRAGPARRRRFVPFLRLLQCALGILTAWLFFYVAGEALLAIQRSVREAERQAETWLEDR
ncbi:MAG: rhomboid family protein [Planctomycetota bacterium]